MPMVKKKSSTQKQDKFKITLRKEARFFLQPQQTKHRQYEALRAYFVENLPAKEVAARFGYSPGALHVLCHQFRNDPERRYFVETKRGPRYGAKREQSRDRVIELRKKKQLCTGYSFRSAA